MLEIENIGVSFGGVHALRSVTFAAEANHITSVVGPNGAGKTTLFNVVTGFQKPDTGKVVFDGHDVIGRRPSQIASAGLVRTFQKTEVFSGLPVERAVEIGTLCGRHFPIWQTIWPGNIRRTRETSAGETAAILQACGLSHLAGKYCSALSYGEQRILEIALALAARPRLLMLDEPASGLNPTEARSLGDLITGIRASGIGIVLIEHNMKLVMSISDRVVVLHHGEKIAEGNPNSVAGNQRVIDAYLGGNSLASA
jgi:branched-chain amino acid transport system ATP-binding protein